MVGKRGSVLTLALLLAGCQLSLGKNEAVEAGSNANSGTPEVSSKVQDRIATYESSIRYWDTTSQDVRKTILRELAVSSEDFHPGCPKIRYPLICDSDGGMSENSCYFRLSRREKPAILPIMVFTNTLIEQARTLCENEIKKKPTRS